MSNEFKTWVPGQAVKFGRKNEREVVVFPGLYRYSGLGVGSYYAADKTVRTVERDEAARLATVSGATFVYWDSESRTPMHPDAYQEALRRLARSNPQLVTLKLKDVFGSARYAKMEARPQGGKGCSTGADENFAIFHRREGMTGVPESIKGEYYSFGKIAADTLIFGQVGPGATILFDPQSDCESVLVSVSYSDYPGTRSLGVVALEDLRQLQIEPHPDMVKKDAPVAHSHKTIKVVVRAAGVTHAGVSPVYCSYLMDEYLLSKIESHRGLFEGHGISEVRATGNAKWGPPKTRDLLDLRSTDLVFKSDGTLGFVAKHSLHLADFQSDYVDVQVLREALESAVDGEVVFLTKDQSIKDIYMDLEARPQSRSEIMRG